jgi:hypothetical protein
VATIALVARTRSARGRPAKNGQGATCTTKGRARRSGQGAVSEPAMPRHPSREVRRLPPTVGPLHSVRLDREISNEISNQKSQLHAMILSGASTPTLEDALAAMYRTLQKLRQRVER